MNHKITVATTLLFTTTSPVLNAEKKDVKKTTSARPNIIVIMTDDQTVHSLDYMPNLQELLIDQGTTFTNFIINVPHCCPSRATLQRGQYAHNHQVITNRAPDGGFSRFRELDREQSTVATWLQDAGYRTVFLGKYLNGYPGGSTKYIPPGWDEWYAFVQGHYYNYKLNENRDIVEYGTAPEDYATDVFADKAADFIGRTSGESPFFIMLATNAPHTPFQVASRHNNQFTDLQAPRPPSFNEADVSDKPEWIRDNRLLNQDEIDSIDDNYRKRLRMLLAVDDMLETIVDALAANNELDNTYIFFTSDNGFHKGEHRRERGKGSPYEEAIRVPLVVRGPGVPQSQELEHVTSNIDLAPTFAALGGANTPSWVDGIALKPLLGSEPSSINSWRQGALVQHWRYEGAGYSIPDYKGLRTLDYLYVEYDTDEIELYDLHNDPYQLENLDQTADPELLSALSAQLQYLSNCAGADCFGDGSVPVEMVSFSATVLENSIHLDWQTETETNNLGFDVERSANGDDFIKIGFVNGNGTSVVPHKYSFEDVNLLAGMYSYRLRQIDYDGRFEYSHAIEANVTAPKKISLAQNYPNPFNPETIIRYELPVTKHVVIKIYNIHGKEVNTLVDAVQAAGAQKVVWDGKNYAGREVPTGLYFYRLQSGELSATRRLIRLR